MPPDPDRAARLRTADLQAQRAAARDCRDAAARSEVLEWPTVAALASAATCEDRTTRVLARSALVQTRSLSTTSDEEGRRAWHEENDRVRDLLARIAASDSDPDPADPGDDRGRAVLVEQLARTPRTSVFAGGDVLGDALSHGDPTVRRALASAVFANGVNVGSGVAAPVDVLISYATDPEPAVRAAVATAFGTAADHEGIAAVVDMLGDSDPRVRRAAVVSFHEESDRDLREAYGPTLANRFVRLATACVVDPDATVRRKAEGLVRPEAIREHPDWRMALLPVLAGGFRDGCGQTTVSLLRRVVEGEPEALVPYLDVVIDPGGTVQDRAAGARLVTMLLETSYAEQVPVDRVVDALVAAVIERTDEHGCQDSLTALETVAKSHPDRVREALPALYRALSDGNRNIRSGAHDVLVTLAAQRPDAVPAPVRALDDAETIGLDPQLDSRPEFVRNRLDRVTDFTALVDEYPGFVQDRVADFVALVAEHPAAIGELDWRWWPTYLTTPDSSVLDAIVDLLAAMLRGDSRDRERAGRILRHWAEDDDLDPLIGTLREAVSDGPAETAPEVLATFHHAVTDCPDRVEPALPVVAEWLTWHEGRTTAANILVDTSDEALDAHGESLPVAARLLLDADALRPGCDPLAALARIDPEQAGTALAAIVDRFCEDGTGGRYDVLDAVLAVYEDAPDVSRMAIKRCDDRLDHYGRRLLTAVAFVERIETGPDEVAAAGLGLLLTALEFDNGPFRSRIAPVLARVATVDPGAAAVHVEAIVERLYDSKSIRENTLTLLTALLDSDPDETTLTRFTDALRTRVLATPPRRRQSNGLLGTFRVLHETAPEYVNQAAAPLGLVAMVDAAGGFDEIDPATVHRALRRAARCVGTDPSALDGLAVVVTGTIEGYTRDGFRNALERRGAHTTGSISGRTDILVVGDDPGTVKRRDALAEGVPMIQETAVRALLDAS